MCTLEIIKAKALFGEFDDVMPASLKTALSQPFQLADGLQMAFKVEGTLNDAWQEVTFLAVDFVDITQAKAAEVASVIAAQVQGITAQGIAGIVLVETVKQGKNAKIEVLSGSANAFLQFPLLAIGMGVSDEALQGAIDMAKCKYAGLAGFKCFCQIIALWVFHYLVCQGELAHKFGGLGNNGKLSDVKREKLDVAEREYVTAADLGFNMMNAHDLSSTCYGSELLDLLSRLGPSVMVATEPVDTESYYV